MRLTRDERFLAETSLTTLALVAIAALSGGCAAVTALPIGSMLGSPNAASVSVYHSTETRLEKGNFVTVKTNVVGMTSGFSLLGFVTIVPAKFSKAMGRLYANAKLRPGQSQTLVNFNMNQDSTYLILFSIPRTYVSADVVEFLPATVANAQPQPIPSETKPRPHPE